MANKSESSFVATHDPKIPARDKPQARSLGVKLLRMSAARGSFS